MDDSFVSAFIDDYYAECDEHLATVRRILLAIEENPGVAPPPRYMQDLARSLHTLKGLSGMVGFADAEQLAHLIEDWVRATTTPGRPLSPSALDGLFAGARLLEAVIPAHRENTAAPDIAWFASLVRDQTGNTGVPGPVSRPGDARIVECVFTPAPDRAGRGVNVDTIRARLSEAGTIVEAEPKMLEGGRVAFRFVIELHRTAPVPESDSDAGLEVTLRPQAAAPPQVQNPQESAGPLAGSSIVRVELARLDELMRLVGDMVITRGRLEAGIGRLRVRDNEAVELEDANAQLERQLRDLGEALRRARMVAISEVFERMRYAAREVARETGKAVHVATTGAGTEVDKVIVERMLEPLLHLVRNAVGHGIEAPAGRKAAGKDAVGRITLRARTAGERIIIEVEDDGAGLDYARITDRARRTGIMGDLQTVDATNVLDVLSAPGFSTHEDVDMTSGRGVGMAVAHERVRDLGGQLTVHAAPGAGTRFTISLPLTLMIVDALMFQLNGSTMAAPQPGVIEVLQVERDTITRMENNEVIVYREGYLPLFHLRDVFNLPRAESTSAALHVLVINTVEEPIGVIVDRITGQQEIVVRALTDRLVTVAGISGATELSDGSVALIVDTAALTQRALRTSTAVRVVTQ